MVVWSRRVEPDLETVSQRTLTAFLRLHAKEQKFIVFFLGTNSRPQKLQFFVPDDASTKPLLVSSTIPSLLSYIPLSLPCCISPTATTPLATEMSLATEMFLVAIGVSLVTIADSLITIADSLVTIGVSLATISSLAMPLLMSSSSVK